MKCLRMSVYAYALAALAHWAAAGDAPDRFLPAESLNLKLAAPIDTWDEAIPLGNGLLGGLLWGGDGDGPPLLDRGDLWDLRVQERVQRRIAPGRRSRDSWPRRTKTELVRRFDAPYYAPWPTKLPGGRLELSLDPSQRVASVHARSRPCRGPG